MEEPHDFGPLQMLTVAFDGNSFKGEILPELERLKREGIVRVVDMLAVRKDAAGAYAVVTASDLEWLEATQFGAYIGTLVGFGAGGLEGAQRGAIAGLTEADGQSAITSLLVLQRHGDDVLTAVKEHVAFLASSTPVTSMTTDELRPRSVVELVGT